ncbi:hypothetical protein V492_06112 [Pseudogymnoascus sp. VKM F-4246]|nr:hypothetical protein V492_06112 [Pseudogymnoascus sp. VKM F-4246]
MHFTALILLAASAAAFTIPIGQPDGTYQVFTAPDGTETHTLIKAHVDTRNTVPGKFDMAHKRTIAAVPAVPAAAGSSVNCGGYPLPHQETDDANNAVDEFCGGGRSVGKHNDFYSLKGCTVAYFCNYDNGPQSCYASERQSTSRTITDFCGWYNAGWNNVQTTGRNVQYGYENNCNQGWNFCGCGTDGC